MTSSARLFEPATLCALAARRLGYRLALRITRLIRQAAAVLREEGDEIVHPFDVGAVIEIPTLSTIDDQSGVRELLQMEGQCWCGNVEPLNELRRRIALWAALHE
jgi:hypothetical protein